MRPNFVTFYLILVLITGPFFQFIPISPENLFWDDILLGKVLNQAPTLFLLFHITFQAKKQPSLVFLLFIAFLVSCIFSELYHYFINPDNVFLVIVAHNSFSYLILICLFYHKSKLLKRHDKAVFIRASIITGLIILCFSFSAHAIYMQYFQAYKTIFAILILFIICAIAVVFLSFFSEKPFQRTWYEIIIGTVLMILVDIYTYSCMFVFETSPNLLYTLGKVFFSVGILLLADGILRKRFSLQKTEIE
jgi:hypothetical protein